ncbi:MAG: tRNA (N(6)-L-threonylcarbamoyladenosine(37)-C(2))-methylthiotransferase MtaB [SAR324 cluster bacterium]|nr:tRNA (N(6)-L-threonylcarbamoyladenosine(37)-C(2))-methylthiotransferase MtaB [SAR324 cluster bacterium]
MLSAKFHTFGCRLNHTETSSMAKSLADAGFSLVEQTNSLADVHVINSCSVTNQAVKKCKQLIRSIKRNDSNAKIVLAGCFAQSHLADAMSVPGVDILLGNVEKFSLADYLKDYAKNSEATKVVDVKKIPAGSFMVNSPPTRLTKTRVNLKIQDGCDFFCSFCIIPFARGRSRSRDIDNLLAEANLLVSKGFRELVLTGVNIGLYQNKGVDFMGLLAFLAKIKGLDRIRISSIEPTTIDESLLEEMADSDSKIVNHLHLPLQSGNDIILRDMRRKYTCHEFLDFTQKAVSMVPNICIGTDVIVGFPSETKDDFAKTYRFLDESPINYFHVFPFSIREGTVAAKIKFKENQAEHKRWAKSLRTLSSQKWRLYYIKYIGEKMKILLEDEVAVNLWRGYSSNYIRVLVAGENLANKICQVEVTNFDDQFNALKGKLV